MEKQGYITQIVDFFLSPNKEKYLFLLFIFAFILRIIVANNVAPLADEMIHGVNSINIINSGVINAQNQAPAWLYLTDVSYKLFGVHSWSARFVSVLFGSLTIFVVYLLGLQFFSKKIAFVSAIIFTFSSYYARYALMEMDQALMFFVLVTFYYLIKDFNEKKELSKIAPFTAGIAVLIKPIALPFLFSMGLCFLFLVIKERKSKELFITKKATLIGGIVIFILLLTPILSYNYILYEQKGITDVIFSRFLGINQDVYSSLQGYDKTFAIKDVYGEGGKSFFISYLKLDPLIFIFGLLGIVLLAINRKNRTSWLLILLHLIPLIFLLGTSWLQTHLQVFVPLFSITSAFFIVELSEYGKKAINPRISLAILVAIIIIVNFFIILPNISSSSAITKMREYSIDRTTKQSVIIADARIYRGRIAWMFNDRPYLESSYLPQLLQMNENLTDKKYPIDVYFIECVPDDCGWGTISAQQEFNESSESVVKAFQKNSLSTETIYGGGGYDETKGEPYFNIYHTKLELSPRVFDAIYSTHDWFYYPVRWEKNDWYDKYTPNGFIQITLNLLGKIMLWISILGALIIPIFILKELKN